MVGSPQSSVLSPQSSVLSFNPQSSVLRQPSQLKLTKLTMVVRALCSKSPLYSQAVLLCESKSNAECLRWLLNTMQTMVGENI